MSRLDAKRIVVTRAEAQASDLSARLERLGAVALRCPTIQVIPPDSPAALDTALSRLESYEWLIVTSPNGARAVLARLEHLALPLDALGSVRVAAVGQVTASVFAERRSRVDFVPEDERSEALARDLSPVVGERILLARSDLADASLAASLLERGAAHVDDVAAYRTVPSAPPMAALEELRGGVDAVTFTSPSTVEGFLRIGPGWRELVGNAVVATIGPVTTDAARKAGFDRLVEAQDRSTAGLVEALVRGFTDA